MQTLQFFCQSDSVGDPNEKLVWKALWYGFYKMSAAGLVRLIY